ncbi:hypothetical protein BGW39_009943 [Mortierella sp. 14UC]|nr:hypothetical protein BGW39_009943 [Mortierella sp. 14UC]
MLRQPHDKDQEKQESDSSDKYYRESASPSQSRSPSPTPSENPAPASPSSPAKKPPLRRVIRSLTPKPKKPTTVTTPSTPKTLTTPRTIVTRARVVKKKEAAAGKVTGKRGEVVQSEVGDIESDFDVKPVITPAPKKPRPRTKGGGGGVGVNVQVKRDVEPGDDPKPAVKPSTPKSLRAKPKGGVTGDPPDTEAVTNGDTKLVKTPTPKRPRGGTGRAKAPTTPRKPCAPRSTMITTMAPVAPTAPLFSPIHADDAYAAEGTPSTGPPSKAPFPFDSPMDGVEMEKYVAATTILTLMTPNRDYEMITMPQQERNGRGYRYRHSYDAFERSPTVLPETPTLDEVEQDTARATDARTLFSPILKTEFHTPEQAQQSDRHQSRSTDPAVTNPFPLSAKATELYLPDPFGPRPYSHLAETRPIVTQPPMTTSRSTGLKLDLSTLSPWLKATARQPTSSMPTSFGETKNPYAATTTTAIATTTPSAASTPESIQNLSKTVDAAYYNATSLLARAISLTNNSLKEQADALRYHTVAQQVFHQGLRMIDSQWRVLFPYERIGDQMATSVCFPSPPSPFRAACASPLSVMLTPKAHGNPGTSTEGSFVDTVKNTPETTTRLPDQGSVRARSSSSPLLTPVVIPRRDYGEAGPVQPTSRLSTTDFENELVQPSIFAQNRQSYTATPSPLQQQSVQALEPLVAPCVAMSFDTVMSAMDRSSAVKVLLRARLNATPENEQHLRHNDYNQYPQGQSQNTTQGQYQQNYLATPCFATLKAPLDDHNQQRQRDQYRQQQEMEGKRKKGSEVGGAAERMTIHLSESQWNKVREQSTELYVKAVKSYEVSMEANHASRESHDRYNKLFHYWKGLTDGDVRKD